MSDPILVFPRVIHRDFDPSPNNDVSEGYIEGNVWINSSTGKIFSCVDKQNGVWVEMVTIASDSGSDIIFDITPGRFIIDANNVKLNEFGNLDLTGEQLTLNTDATSPPTDMCYFNIFRGGGPEQNSSISWNEDANRWEAGVRPNLWPIVTAVLQTRDPRETDYENHFVGQTWVNLVTQQKFTCVSRIGGIANWRLALTSAPTKSFVEDDDHVILYGSDDKTFTKLHWDRVIEWIRYELGLGISPAITEYGFQLDTLSNIMPSEEDPVTFGNLEVDGDDNLTPIAAPTIDTNDEYFEIDGDDNIMVKEIV